ncbi:MAG: sulfur carrier protein ThiS [Deltaproteobacteria bacterium]|nr:sulfur carrier protein ThiS [Deltaproteobacteria bacterium]
MDIQLNGERRTLPSGADLFGLLESLGKDARMVAIEVNGEIVRRPRYSETILRSDDRVEVVHFVQGG